MNWWRRFREFDRKGLFVDRVEGRFAFTRKGYVINRGIFWVYFAVLLMMLLGVGYVYRDVGWRSMHFSCGDDSLPPGCENPCFGKEDCGVAGSLRDVPFIPPGEGFGSKPPEGYLLAVRWCWSFAFLGFLMSLCFNHRVHNRGRSFLDLFPDLEVRE